MFYFVNAHRASHKDQQMTFYPNEVSQMLDWMMEQADNGWTVTFKVMNQNQEQK